MGRAPCCSGEHTGLKKGPWTHEEDQKLTSFLLLNPNTSWRLVPPKAGLLRCGKSCRLRWMNYLRPDIRRGNFTPDEENLIIQLHAAVGNKWSVIASQLPGRTDNEIKNLWNTRLRKILVLQGINPITHQPLCNPLLSDYVKQWVKSIESVIITSLTTTQSSTSYNNNNISSPINGPLDVSLLPFGSLPPQSCLLEGSFARPDIANSTSQYSTFNGESWVGETSQRNGSFIDDLTVDEGASLPSNLSDYILMDGNPFTFEGGLDLMESGAPANLEEGFKYWN